eukprot:4740484-Pleurochrysis_carterae.AAC.2
MANLTRRPEVTHSITSIFDSLGTLVLSQRSLLHNTTQTVRGECDERESGEMSIGVAKKPVRCDRSKS